MPTRVKSCKINFSNFFNYGTFKQLLLVTTINFYDFPLRDIPKHFFLKTKVSQIF